MANGKDCAVFDTSVKFGVLIPVTIENTLKADSHVAVYRYEYDVRSMVSSS